MYFSIVTKHQIPAQNLRIMLRFAHIFLSYAHQTTNPFHAQKFACKISHISSTFHQHAQAFRLSGYVLMCQTIHRHAQTCSWDVHVSAIHQHAQTCSWHVHVTAIHRHTCTTCTSLQLTYWCVHVTEEFQHPEHLLHEVLAHRSAHPCMPYTSFAIILALVIHTVVVLVLWTCVSMYVAFHKNASISHACALARTCKPCMRFTVHVCSYSLSEDCAEACIICMYIYIYIHTHTQIHICNCVHASMSENIHPHSHTTWSAGIFRSQFHRDNLNI